MTPKRIGIIGLSHWYWAYGCAYGIALHPEATLAAIADENLANAEKMAEVYGAAAAYGDYHELLSSPQVDAVVITTTTRLHDEVARDAAAAGMDILLGKPVSRTLKGADQTIEAVRRAGVKLMVMGSAPPRTDSAARLIGEGAIGTPYAAELAMWAIPPLSEPGSDSPGWFVDPQEAAGGGFVDHAIYAVGKARRYFSSEVKSVYAEMGRFAHRDWTVEDHGVAVLRFGNGSMATVTSTFTAPQRTHGRVLVIGTQGELEVQGSKVTVWSRKEPYNHRQSWEFLPPDPVHERSYAEIPVPTPPFAASYRATVAEFVAFITDGTEPSSTPEDARANLEVCLAAYKSAATRAVVDLPLTQEVDVPGILAQI